MWVCFGFPGHFSCHYMIHRLIGCLIKAMVSQAKLLQFKGTNFLKKQAKRLMFKELIGIIACPITQKKRILKDSDVLYPRVNTLGV